MASLERLDERCTFWKGLEKRDNFRQKVMAHSANNPRDGVGGVVFNTFVTVSKFCKLLYLEAIKDTRIQKRLGQKDQYRSL